MKIQHSWKYKREGDTAQYEMQQRSIYGTVGNMTEKEITQQIIRNGKVGNTTGKGIRHSRKYSRDTAK